MCECEGGKRKKERGDGQGVFECVRGRERETKRGRERESERKGGERKWGGVDV
jgi:hypothetical protein